MRLWLGVVRKEKKYFYNCSFTTKVNNEVVSSKKKVNNEVVYGCGWSKKVVGGGNKQETMRLTMKFFQRDFQLAKLTNISSRKLSFSSSSSSTISSSLIRFFEIFAINISS